MAHFKNFISKRFNFILFLIKNLPMAWLAGLKIEKLEDDVSSISVPYKWLTTNPFKSIYFACLAMAAELSSGILVMMYIKEQSIPISMLVVKIQGEFTKKANQKILFTCVDGLKIKEAVKNAIESNEIVTIDTLSVGLNTDNEEVCRFNIQWSIKSK